MSSHILQLAYRTAMPQAHPKQISVLEKLARPHHEFKVFRNEVIPNRQDLAPILLNQIVEFSNGGRGSWMNLDSQDQHGSTPRKQMPVSSMRLAGADIPLA